MCIQRELIDTCQEFDFHFIAKFQASFSIHLEDEDVSAGDIRAEVIGPDSRHSVHFNWVGRTGEGYFTPTETGAHKVQLFSSSLSSSLQQNENYSSRLVVDSSPLRQAAISITSLLP